MLQDDEKELGRALIEAYGRNAEIALRPTAKERADENLEQKSDYAKIRRLLQTIPKIANEGDDRENPAHDHRAGDPRPYSAQSKQMDHDNKQGIEQILERIDGNQRGEGSDTAEPGRINPSLTGDA